jgi:hypothetical protein
VGQQQEARSARHARSQNDRLTGRARAAVSLPTFDGEAGIGGDGGLGGATGEVHADAIATNAAPRAIRAPQGLVIRALSDLYPSTAPICFLLFPLEDSALSSRDREEARRRLGAAVAYDAARHRDGGDPGWSTQSRVGKSDRVEGEGGGRIPTFSGAGGV